MLSPVTPHSYLIIRQFRYSGPGKFWKNVGMYRNISCDPTNKLLFLVTFVKYLEIFIPYLHLSTSIFYIYVSFCL